MQRDIICIVLTLCLYSSTAWAYSGGTGEPNNPYQIATAEELIALGNEPDDYDKNFILTADIDLSGYLFDRAVIAPDTNDLSDDFQGTAFSGFFAGQGHVISGLYIVGQDYLGLFGCCASQAVIMQLGLDTVSITAIGEYAGGLVGDNEGSITSSYTQGIVSVLTEPVGGLVGRNGGSLISCYSTATVSGTGPVGGLVGSNDQGTIISSYSTGTVTVESSGSGGGRGTGRFISERRIGSGGGLVGEDKEGLIFSSFWDIQSSGQSESAGGIGLTTAEMQTLATYIHAGWDLTGEVALGTRDIWTVQEGAYPKLTAFSDDGPLEPNGFGTQESPYLLTDANELGTVWSRPWACYRLEANIDLVGTIWNSAVVPLFMGVFDGNDHVINHLSIQGDSNLGLFGHCTAEATLTNLTLEAVDVNGSGDTIGGLVGTNAGSITSCSISGAVFGNDATGGLAGWNNGSMMSCFSSVSVSGIVGQSDGDDDNTIGGLAGTNIGSITSSTNSGTVSGDNDDDWNNYGYDYDMTGGLAGYNEGTITSCTNSGMILGGDKDYVGGLVGYNRLGSISSSDNSGTIIGVYYVGGLIGGNSMESSITACTNTGTVMGIDYSGGLMGYNSSDSTITSCTNAGTISGGSYVGGLVGRNRGPIASSKNSGTIINGWFATGGLAGKNSGPITSCYNTASIHGTSYVGGLFGTNEGSVLSSYSVGKVTSDGSASNTLGGLIGSNSGSVAASYCSGNVFSAYSPYMWDESTVGGFVGINGGSITSCYYTGNVTGYDITSGFVGKNSGSITSSYSNGAVKNDFCPEMYINEGPSGWGFSAFNSGIITSSFWDTQTAEVDDSDGGTGLTTVEMQDPNTYLDAGWDFTCETANGPNDVWTMEDGDYPRLTWEWDEPPLCPIEATELNSRNFNRTLAQGIVLVDFYATWCSHCDTQAPIIDEVATQVQVQGLATVAKLDIDRMEGVLNTYGITGVPTLILFNNGVEINRFVGVTQAPVLVAAIEAVVEEYAAN